MSETHKKATVSVQASTQQVSPYRQQLETGLRWLHFERSLEDSYRRASFERSAPRLRLTLLVVLALALSMILLDTFIVRVSVSNVIMIWRYGVLVPAILVALLSTFLPEGWRWYRRIVTIIGPVILSAATVLVVNIQAHGNQSIFGVLILAITFIYYLVGLSFYVAVATNLVGLLTFYLSGVYFGVVPAILTYQLVVALFASVVGAILAYNLEWLQRETWLEKGMLEEMADRDGLTGIFNRRRLEMHLHHVWEQAMRESKPLALMMIDVDHFKPFNDRYGHQAADEVLKQVAEVLASAARRPLDMAARYGGEEFVVVLFDTNHDHAVSRAQQIVQDVRLLGIPHATSGASDVVTVSIGLAHVTPSAGRTVEGLLQIADQGLYIAKDSGRNRVEVMSQAEYAQMRTGWFDRNGMKKQ